MKYFRLQQEGLVEEERSLLWMRISSGIQRERRKRTVRIWSSVAAAILAGVAVGFSLYWNQTRYDSIDTVAEQMPEYSPADDNINLVLSPDETIVLEDKAEVVNSVTGDIMVNEEKVSQSAREETVEYAQLVVPKGKHTKLILSDGSSIHVNSGTRVVYPRVFSRQRREIFVDGEIYIDVRPDRKSPFIVKTGKFDVEVLGTAFNVCAYKEDSFAEVTLVRGAVKLTDSRKGTMELSPDQKARIDDGRLSGKQTVEAWKYTAWTDGLLILEGEPLTRVLDRLERYYGDDITTAGLDVNPLIRGSLDLNCTLCEVLERISVIAPVQAQKTDDGFKITMK